MSENTSRTPHRRRVACEACRRAKVKCERENGPCSRCAAKGISCAEVPSPLSNRNEVLSALGPSEAISINSAGSTSGVNGTEVGQSPSTRNSYRHNPPPHLHRVVMACDGCRGQKVKCQNKNDKRPCVRCMTRNRRCTYNDVPALDPSQPETKAPNSNDGSGEPAPLPCGLGIDELLATHFAPAMTMRAQAQAALEAEQPPSTSSS